MKSKTAIFAALIALTGSALGSVTINFSSFDAQVAQNFANSGGVATDGMFYGIIVDGNGDGFSSSYAAVNLALSGQYLLTTTSGGATGDVMILSGFLTGDTSGYVDIDGNAGGTGGLFDVADIPFGTGVGAGIGLGDAFRVVWFSPGNSESAGYLADASFTMPADGGLVDITAPFAGTDPIRSAGLGYTGTSGTPTDLQGITFVPEPSSALLGAVGALGLLRRRRN